MNNQEVQTFLETIYDYVDKKTQEANSSVAKIIGATITGITGSGRYKVKVNPFDKKELTVWAIGDDYLSVDSEANVSGTIVGYKDSSNSSNRVVTKIPDSHNEEGSLKAEIITTRTKRYKEGDNVFLIYWGDLTNAKILCLNN